MNRTTRITTPATDASLTTLATLKDLLQITDTLSDTFLTRQIAAASSEIAAYCGRVFGRHVVEDTFRITGVPGGWHERYVRQVQPLGLSRDLLDPTVMNVAVTLNGVAMDPSLYYVDDQGGLVWRFAASGIEVHWTGSIAVVTYTAGWLLPSDPNPTLPGVIEDAALNMAAQAWYGRGRDPNVLRESAQDVGMVIYEPPPAVDSTDTRLDAYKLRGA